MTKYVSLKDDIYDKLLNLKPDEDRSFSFVIKNLMDNDTDQKKDIQKKGEMIDKLIKENNELRLQVAEKSNELEKYKAYD